MIISFIKKRYLLFFFAFICSFSVFSQQIDAYRWESSFSVTRKLNNKWQVNGQIRTRTNTENNVDQQSSLNRIDFRGYLTYRLFNLSKLTLGYMTRSNNPLDEAFNEQRLIEQYAFFKEFNKYRFTNKFTVEQRIIRKQFIGRYRYALALDFPLNGEQLDKGEMYFFSQAGMLYSANSERQGLENRINIGLGKMFKSGHRFQLDLESRTGDLLGNQNLTIQINTAYYISY